MLILDLGLPDIDGQTLICRLCTWTDLPIIVLSARNQESDITLLALDNGADDYLTKPFNTAELLSLIIFAGCSLFCWDFSPALLGRCF